MELEKCRRERRSQLDVRRAHEREKHLLLEYTKRVVTELERFSDCRQRLQTGKRAMEE